MRSEPRAFRFKSETIAKIDDLHERYSVSKTDIVERAIRAYNGEVVAHENVLQTKTPQFHKSNNTLIIKVCFVCEVELVNGFIAYHDFKYCFRCITKNPFIPHHVKLMFLQMRKKKAREKIDLLNDCIRGLKHGESIQETKDFSIARTNL